MPAIDNLPFKKFMYFKDGKVIEKDGETVIIHRGWSGHLVNALIHDKQVEGRPYYGAELHLTFVDETDVVVIQMNLNSTHAKTFLKISPNIDVSQPLSLIPQLKVIDGQRSHGLLVLQNKNALKWAYTNDNPNGMPMPETKNNAEGKEYADYSKQNQFLLNEAGANLVNRLQKKKNPFPYHPFYEPAKYENDLAGGYFDEQSTKPTATNSFQPFIPPSEAGDVKDDLPF